MPRAQVLDRVQRVGKGDVLAALLQHVENADLVDGLEIGLLGLDLRRIDEVHQRIVHRYHAEFA
jgi:hypothetical protein